MAPSLEVGAAHVEAALGVAPGAGRKHPGMAAHNLLLAVAFLPQFVNPAGGSPLTQLLGLSAVFMAMTFGVFVLYGLLAHAFRKAVIESVRVQAWLRRGFAAAFAGLGVQLAVSDR